MKKQFLKKKLVIIVLLALTILLIDSNNSKAALQANSYTNKSGGKNGPSYWIKEFRKMEQEGEAMGLAETIDEITLEATSASNNIDVHMIKTTEYGAIAILSASGYGNPSNNKVITSTTGNNTGVIIDTRKMGMGSRSIKRKIFRDK